MFVFDFPVDTGRKLNVHKTFRRSPSSERLMYVQFMSCVYAVLVCEILFLLNKRRSSNQSASTRRAQLSVTAKAVRPTDLLNHVKT